MFAFLVVKTLLTPLEDDAVGDINWKPRKIAKAAITTAEIPAISLLRDPLDLRL